MVSTCSSILYLIAHARTLSLSLSLHDSHATKENFALSPTHPPSLTPSPFAIKLGVALGTHSSPGWLVYLFFFHDSLIPNSARGFHTCPAPAAQRLTLFQAGPPLSHSYLSCASCLAAHLIPGRSLTLCTPVSSQLPRSSPHSEQVPDSQASHSSQHPYKPSNSSCVCVCGWG